MMGTRTLRADRWLWLSWSICNRLNSMLGLVAFAHAVLVSWEGNGLIHMHIKEPREAAQATGSPRSGTAAEKDVRRLSRQQGPFFP